jgi:GNAT superfamily N-acetyltransferase
LSKRRISIIMPDPNLQVSPLLPEEAAQYVHIRHETFRTTVNKILYSRGEASQKTLDRVTRETQEGISKGTLFLKCVDTSTGEIVAGARWRYVKPKDPHATERTWEEVEAGFKDRLEPYDESDPEMLTALLDLFEKYKREYLANRPYYVLDTLVTLSQHERRGAGSMLVRWGCEKADEAGVQAYLEASPMGAPLYARHGFVGLGEIQLDLKKYGGDEVMRFIVSIGSTWKSCGHCTDGFAAHAEADQGRTCCVGGGRGFVGHEVLNTASDSSVSTMENCYSRGGHRGRSHIFIEPYIT